MLSVRIVAHPKRERWATELHKELGGEITWDERSNAWDTHRRALLSAEGSHVLLIQDDAVPSEGLVPSLERAIGYSGEHPICCYSQATRRLGEIERLGPVSWWQGLGPLYGVANVIPVRHIRDIVRVGDVYRGPSCDRRLWMWYQAQGITCYYTWPSLVEHRGVDSLMWGQKRKDRPAHSFGSGLGIDWSVEPLHATEQTIYPRVVLWKEGRHVTVRKWSSIWRRRIAGGWEEQSPPEGGL